MTNGKFAAYVGSYETQMGVLVVKQDGNKLIGDAGGEIAELVPQTEADKFNAMGASVTFERDKSGKIVGVTIAMPNGREMKGKKKD